MESAEKMEQSSVMRRPNDDRQGRGRLASFAVVVGLAALAWAVVILAWFALNAWLT